MTLLMHTEMSVIFTFFFNLKDKEEPFVQVRMGQDANKSLMKWQMLQQKTSARMERSEFTEF